jgi:orotate phosphoribosyltransferase-like protein
MDKKLVFKDEILSLKNNGFSTGEISKMLNKSYGYVATILKRYDKNSDSKEGFFNVNKYECWLSPASL